MKKMIIALVLIATILLVYSHYNNETNEYTCPEGEYVNCMPPIAEDKIEICNDEEYKQWIEENCEVEFVY